MRHRDRSIVDRTECMEKVIAADRLKKGTVVSDRALFYISCPIRHVLSQATAI